VPVKQKEVIMQKNKEETSTKRINSLKDLFDFLESDVFAQPVNQNSNLGDWLGKQTKACHFKITPYYTSVHDMETLDIIGDKTLSRVKVTLELEELGEDENG